MSKKTDAERLRKALRRTPDGYIDLIQYLVDRKMTRREARQKLIEGKVMAGSHRVGRLEIDLGDRKEWVIDPYLPADKRSEIVVLP